MQTQFEPAVHLRLQILGFQFTLLGATDDACNRSRSLSLEPIVGACSSMEIAIASAICACSRSLWVELVVGDFTRSVLHTFAIFACNLSLQFEPEIIVACVGVVLSQGLQSEHAVGSCSLNLQSALAVGACCWC